MDLVLSLPFEVRLIGFFLLGAILGSLANGAIYSWAYSPRPIGPWPRRAPDGPSRQAKDWIPIFGWLPLRREVTLHGVGYWIRPLCIELFFGLFAAWLYWWEIDQGALLPSWLSKVADPQWLALFHLEYAVHLVFFWLLLVASMIDLDERMIPDLITLPGTLFLLVIAACLPKTALSSLYYRPDWLEPTSFWTLLTPADWPTMTFTSPLELPGWIFDFPALIIGLGCWLGWCFALTDRLWYSRHGWLRAVRLFWVHLIRSQISRLAFLLASHRINRHCGQLGKRRQWMDRPFELAYRNGDRRWIDMGRSAYR